MNKNRHRKVFNRSCGCIKVVSESANSTTTAGISGIAGNTAVRSTDAQSGIKPIFDAAKVQREVDAQTEITQYFGQQASKAVGDYAQSKYNALKLSDPEEAKKWAEGGGYRVALHIATGALGGGVSGALGAGVSASSAELMNGLQDGLTKALMDTGLSLGAAQILAQGVSTLTMAGVGAALGGAQGAATAATVDANNRQLHPTEIQWIKANANRYAMQRGISVADAERQLAEQAFRQVQFGAESGVTAWNTDASSFLKQAGQQTLPGDPNVPGQNVGYMFYATPEQRANANMYLASTVAYADFYKQNGLEQPTPAQLTQAALRDGQLRSNLDVATKAALAVSASLALGGLSPSLLQWALSNPIAATQAGIISAETAAAIVSGAVTPSGLLQQVSNPQVARVIYSRLAAAATQNIDGTEVVLGRYLAGSANSYEQVAQARGATYYEVTAWSAMEKELGRGKMWEINKAFLDKAITDGKAFVFTGNPSNFPSGFSRDEYQHLVSKGYSFVEDGRVWRGIKK